MPPAALVWASKGRRSFCFGLLNRLMFEFFMSWDRGGIPCSWEGVIWLRGPPNSEGKGKHPTSKARALTQQSMTMTGLCFPLLVLCHYRRTLCLAKLRSWTCLTEPKPAAAGCWFLGLLCMFMYVVVMYVKMFKYSYVYM